MTIYPRIALHKIKLVKNQSQTGRLAGTLYIKLNARFLITLNVDFQDRLVNRQLGTVKHIALNSQKNVLKNLCRV